MRRKFDWAFLSACVALGLLACGGENPAPTNVIPAGGEGGSGPGPGGGGGEGGSDNIPGVAGATGFIDPNDPVAGAGGCSGECGGAGGSGGNGSLCGNGALDAGEQCDDGNPLQGDGCNGVCNLEPNFACAQVGEACVSTIACGDGNVAGTEACDDGNVADGDGCSASCSAEPGFGCTTGDDGSVCIPIVNPACGDSSVSSGEQCDDGDTDAGDGCSATCQVESGYVCPTVGQQCDSVEYCGDGFLRDGAEQCDDGNQSPVDGCDGGCNILPNFICPTPGAACQSTVVCGDSAITGNETCDDGDAQSGDGCSNLCRAEAGYSCTGGGAAPVAGDCQAVPEEACGDNALAQSEFCDDGDTSAGDGCSATCTVEPGWDCPVGVAGQCTQVGSCGDNLVNVAGEQCDDGDNQGGDGCTANCQQEALFNCPPTGGSCTTAVVCGDAVVNGSETCDDDGTADTGIDDGCNASCQIKSGFVCPSGAVCRTVCGDGIRAGREQCDDGGTSNGNGCDSLCRLEANFKCTDPASPASAADVCTVTACGDGEQEGTEQCDDGNLAAYDGCDTDCRVEPDCGGTPYTCASECGDGKKFPDEACDDGNILSGDGCSSSCTLEAGFLCTHNAADLGDQLELPIVYRDFNSSHPHFQLDGAGVTPNMVLSTLGANGKPVYNVDFVHDGNDDFTMDVAGTDPNGTEAFNDAQITSLFNQWYVTDPAASVNTEVLGTILLDEISPGVFQFAKSGDGNYFFPLDGLGFNQLSSGNGTHNFHFTSEVRTWFTYDNPAQNPVLTFSGDDDVWVFVNGRLAVDLGGIHVEETGSIELEGSTGQSSIGRVPAGTGTATIVNIPLNPNGVNEIAVFQAERRTTQSNYTLTLQGFNAPLTSCVSDCGDGVRTLDEACDLGDASNTGVYGGCNADCTLAPRCGDGTTQAGQGEQCDNGLNTSTRLNDEETDCAPGCVLPPSCGDGNIDGQFEVCDNGEQNTTPGAYGACGTDCQPGPRCGDGAVQAGNGEQCDTGSANGTSGSPCLSDCRLRCGNDVVDQGEECDDGLAENIGGYGKCESTCTFGPRCGDANTDSGAGETCDDGLNDGSYGTCASNCQAGPFCGDNTVQSSSGELCDNGGANVPSGYAPGLCTTQCKPAPFCGDSAVNVGNGEVCDDGVNDGSPGSCAANCQSAIPLSSCGNGAVNAGEECDNGASNGVPGNSCDVRCELACGNGFVNATEQCDDGVNNGSYGTCNSNCTFAALCGDGVTSGPEACDQGASNVTPSNAYGSNVCTTSCARAPRCGDGRVDTSFGEACDGGPSCTSFCNILH
jgi:fibro-slime domain-containing protein